MATLVDGDEPLVLADGTKIDPKSGKVIRERTNYIEVPNAAQAQKQIASVRRSLAELPAPPREMNAVSLIVTYTLFGLSETDIAIALNITEDQVKRVKTLDAYDDMMQTIKNSILADDADDIRQLIAQQAKRATQKIVDTMDEDGALGFAAAKEILDRAGHRPVDVVEHRHKLDGELTINYRRKGDDAPTIDVDFEEM